MSTLIFFQLFGTCRLGDIMSPAYVILSSLSLSQIKHQLDATLCRFYFCRVTLHVSGVKRTSSGVFKTGTAATGTCVMIADYLPATITHVPVTAVPVLNTPDDGRLTPETCRVTLQK